MAITRFKNSSIANKGPKYDNALAGLPYIPIIGTATDGGNGTSASVAFTGNNVAGAGITYTALSTPGSFTGTGTASPVTVTGLTAGTSYTFQVKAGNSLGDSAYSAASNSVTPVTPTAFESIASTTASGGETSITFSSIPGTYQHLQVRIIGRRSGTGTTFDQQYLQFNNDTGTNYAWHYLSGDGSAVLATGTSSSTSGTGLIIPRGGTTASTFSATIIDIHDYASTSKNKTVKSITGYDVNGSGQIWLTSSLWINTNAITSIKFVTDALAAGSTFALYGIKA